MIFQLNEYSLDCCFFLPLSCNSVHNTISPNIHTQTTTTSELGDIIRNVNGRDINTEGDLFQALEDCQPGDIVDVQVQRVVAVRDELVVRDLILQIPLSESTKFEKNIIMLQEQQ
jgi:PDZ domain